MKRNFGLLLLLVTLNVSAIEINSTLNGVWYNPLQNGHGLNIVSYNQDITIVYWYTYHLDGTPMFLITVGENQGDHFTGTTYYNTGMVFGEFNPDDIQETEWGTSTVTFTSCNEALLEYSSTVEGYGSGSIPMERLVTVPGLECSTALVGAWSTTDPESELLSIAFFEDGTYVHVEYEPDSPPEENGMEWGTYDWNTGNGRITAEQSFDSNSGTGLSEFIAGDNAPFMYISVDAEEMTVEVDENGDEMIDGTLVFVRQASGEIWGTWTNTETENELLAISFASDGTYVHAEVDLEGSVGPNGMEYGMWSWNAETGLMTVMQTFDGNGHSGLSDFTGGVARLYMSVSGDVLTAEFDNDGNGSIDDTLLFNRQF